MYCDICEHECNDCDCYPADEYADKEISKWAFGQLFHDKNDFELDSVILKFRVQEKFKLLLKREGNRIIISKHCDWYFKNWGINGV